MGPSLVLLILVSAAEGISYFLIENPDEETRANLREANGTTAGGEDENSATEQLIEKIEGREFIEVNLPLHRNVDGVYQIGQE